MKCKHGKRYHVDTRSNLDQYADYSYSGQLQNCEGKPSQVISQKNEYAGPVTPLWINFSTEQKKSRTTSHHFWINFQIFWRRIARKGHQMHQTQLIEAKNETSLNMNNIKWLIESPKYFERISIGKQKESWKERTFAQPWRETNLQLRMHTGFIEYKRE